VTLSQYLIFYARFVFCFKKRKCLKLNENVI